MGKAIQGAAMLGGAIAMGALAFANPALIASPLFDKIWASLAIGGVSMEAGAIAGALTSNRGTSITTHQPASFRQIVRSCQRVGGITVYSSTTGSHHDQYNFVIVLAGHEIHAIENLYLDGRKVFWAVGEGGNQTRNGYNFGGPASAGSHVGPGGAEYDFGTLVYCEARYGDQVAGDVIGGLTANDPRWATTAQGSPNLLGCAYVYLKIEYDEAMFPNLPEMRFTLRGKNDIYDPRTGTTGYSENWALHVADALTDPKWGLGCNTAEVWNDQLIAAANVCDEQVALASGDTESRYTLHWHYDTSLAPGDVVAQMMPGAAGRLSRVGGQWYIWPAYWQGPSFEFDKSALTGPVEWTPQKSLRDRCNRVRGTYIASAYPYATSGNLYDSNGWYDGTIANTFPFAFQPTSFPEYACDVNHGYPSDQYLAEDGGVELPLELGLTTVLSITQAQRVAKITLLRNRQQGSGSLPMTLAGWQMMPLDVMYMDFPEMGWDRKVLEVTQSQFSIEDGGDDGAPTLRTTMAVQETDASSYEWSIVEEQTVYAVPALSGSYSVAPAPPTDVALTSSSVTALAQPDGTVVPRIMVTWDEPLDAFATTLQMQVRLSGGSGVWADAGTAAITSTVAYITGVTAGATYDVQVRSVRSSGATSVWVEIDGFTVSLVLSTLGVGAVGVGSLIGEAYTDGTAAILCGTFTCIVGSVSVAVLPGGYTITGLNQSQLYYVYYVDPTFAGGNVVPIATQTVADFRGKIGYFEIDSIVTPANSGSGGSSGTRFAPTTYADSGARTTVTPEAAYDGNVDSVARVSGSVTRAAGGAITSASSGSCGWQGFRAITLAADATLHISNLGFNPNFFYLTVQASYGTTAVTLYDNTGGSGALAAGDLTCTIPAGTALASLSISVYMNPIPSSPIGGTHISTFEISEIYVA